MTASATTIPSQGIRSNASEGYSTLGSGVQNVPMCPGDTIRPMRGAPITIRCDCGQVERVPYGQTWTCPVCGRRWNTEQIPGEEYWGIMREMRNYRLQVVGVSVAFGVGAAFVLANMSVQRVLPII